MCYMFRRGIVNIQQSGFVFQTSEAGTYDKKRDSLEEKSY